MLESTPVLCMSVILRPRKYFPFNVNRKNTFLKRRVKTKKRKKKIKSKYRSRKNMQSTSQDIKWKSIIRVYRLTDNHENFSLPLPFEEHFTSISLDLCSKQCHRGFPGGGHVFIIPRNVRYSITPPSISLSIRFIRPFLERPATRLFHLLQKQ